MKDRALRASLEADLRSAATQQEVYFAAHDAYVGSAEDLTGYTPSPGVILTITYLATDGWAGTTSHRRLRTSNAASP